MGGGAEVDPEVLADTARSYNGSEETFHFFLYPSPSPEYLQAMPKKKESKNRPLKLCRDGKRAR